MLSQTKPTKKTRAEDPNLLYTTAMELLDKKSHQQGMSMLRAASAAKHPKAQLALFLQEEKFIQAAQFCYLTGKKDELYKLYTSQAQTKQYTETESLASKTELLGIKFSPESLIITCYTALLWKDTFLGGNLNQLIKKFPETFIDLVINEQIDFTKLPMLYANTMDTVHTHLYDNLHMSIVVLFQSTSLPTELTKMIIQYMPEYDFITNTTGSKKSKSLDELMTDGQKSQSSLRLKFFNFVGTVVSSKNHDKDTPKKRF